jgi:hypothetical protein
MPIAGSGPHPKIKNGSRIAFKIAEVMIMYMEQFGFPTARKRLSDIIIKKRNGEPKTTTTRYLPESGRMSFVTPKNLRIGPW